MVLADICEDERDYRQADIIGTRLFVTGLPASVDDVRLYLAFEEYGRVLEAQVAKPGLGFVVFEDIRTAESALAGMEGEEISGKEVKVKRARSFYIRKEEEARLKLAQAQRMRETRTAALAEEQSRRVRLMEEAAYARAQGGLTTHARNFDVRGQRRAVLQEMRAEGLLDFSAPLPDVQQQQPFSTHQHSYTNGRAPSPSPSPSRSPSPSPSPYRRRAPDYADSEHVTAHEMRGVMEDIAEAQEDEEDEAPSYPMGAWSVQEEDRIKKQAMIEIMKEGDKLSKTAGAKALGEVHVNIAQLIKERVAQIKRYELLRDNRELLSNITFSAYATQNVRTTGIPGYTFPADGLEDDEESDDGVVVTEAEMALVNMINENFQGNGGGAKRGVLLNGASSLAKGGAEPEAPKRKRGRPRKVGGKTKAYVPTGRPRGRPRKHPKPEEA